MARAAEQVRDGGTLTYAIRVGNLTPVTIGQDEPIRRALVR